MNIQLDDIHVEVVQKNIKNINLRVYSADGHVRVTAPKAIRPEALRAFVVSKKDWIRKQQKKLQGRIVAEKLEFKSDEIHYFFGERYSLKVEEKKCRPSVELNDNCILLTVKPESTIENRQSVMRNWYRAHLESVLPPLIKEHEIRMSVAITEFGIKKMKTRWGTCNTRSKRIWFNLELAKKSPDCLEYIVVHELAHLLEPSHNKRFKSLMDNFLPDWRLRKAELNNISAAVPR